MKYKSGFMLISFLIQLPIMLVMLSAILYFTRVSNTQNKILENCFIMSLNQLTATAPTQPDFFKLIEEEIQKLNLQIKPIAQVHFLNQDSTFVSKLADSENSELVYILKFKISINENPHLIEIEKTCGAQKQCLKQKCRFGIVTDKS